MINLITDYFADYSYDDQSIMTRRRHVETPGAARENFMLPRQVFAKTQSGELVAEELRQTQQQLNEIAGEFSSEDLLGNIFFQILCG